jgi:flagellar hook protein FlgE
MVSPIGTALSGIAAASKRLAVSSENIANQSTADYAVKRARQVSRADGSVDVSVEQGPRNTSFAGDESLTLPAVDVANELVNMTIASYDIKANIKSIQMNDKMQKSLLDILS